MDALLRDLRRDNGGDADARRARATVRGGDGSQRASAARDDAGILERRSRYSPLRVARGQRPARGGYRDSRGILILAR